MPPKGKILLAVAFGYFVMPRIVLEFWGLVDRVKR